MESNKSIFKAISLFGSVQGLNILLNLVRTKIVAQLLGPAGIGLNKIFNEIREFIHSTSNLGMDICGVSGISKAYDTLSKATNEEEQIQYQAKLEQEVCLVRSWVMILALFGVVLCMALSHVIWLLFPDGTSPMDFVWLSPAVGLSTIACGEMAVLKGIRKLKVLASVSVINVLLAIIISLPLYWAFEINGVLPAIILLCLAQAIVVAIISYRYQAPRFNFKSGPLRAGIPMLQLGFSFALAGVVNHFTQLGIASYLSNEGGTHLVGLYSAGFTIVMVYLGGVFFASLDSDYFPRLASIFQDCSNRRETVWRQIRMTALIVIPVTILIIVLLPWILPLLFSNEFNDVIFMTQIAACSLFFRSVYLPLAYIPLAAGDSKIYFVLELVSYIMLAAGVIVGYHFLQLTGTGIGILVSSCLDMVILLFVSRIKYKI